MSDAADDAILNKRGKVRGRALDNTILRKRCVAAILAWDRYSLNTSRLDAEALDGYADMESAMESLEDFIDETGGR